MKQKHFTGDTSSARYEVIWADDQFLYLRDSACNAQLGTVPTATNTVCGRICCRSDNLAVAILQPVSNLAPERPNVRN